MGGRGHVHEAELEASAAGALDDRIKNSSRHVQARLVTALPVIEAAPDGANRRSRLRQPRPRRSCPPPAEPVRLTWRSALSHRNLAGAHDAGLVRSVRHSITALDSGYRSVAMSSIPARAQSRRTQAEAARMTSVGRARTALTRMRSPDGSMKLTPDKSMMRIDGVCDSRSTSLEALTMSSSPLTASTSVSRAHGGRCRVVCEFRGRQVM